MVGHGQRMVPVIGDEVIGMEEIGLARFQQRSLGADEDIVPAHVGDLDRGIGPLDQPHLAADPVQPRGHAMLHPARGEQLHADTDAQERRGADQHALGHCLDQVGDRPQPFGAGPETADTGQDNAIGGADHVRIGGDLHALGPGGLQRICHRVKIARAVIDQRENLSHRADPWSTGSPRPCADRAPPPGASPGQSPCRCLRRYGGCWCRKAVRCAA